VAVAASTALLAGCGGSGSSAAGDTTTAQGGSTGSGEISGSISVMGVWTGQEQASLQAVIKGFRDRYPNVAVKYTSAGDNLPTVLSIAVEGGNPPDLAAVAQSIEKQMEASAEAAYR